VKTAVFSLKIRCTETGTTSRFHYFGTNWQIDDRLRSAKALPSGNRRAGMQVLAAVGLGYVFK
jgi:hypothetical protein